MELAIALLTESSGKEAFMSIFADEIASEKS